MAGEPAGPRGQARARGDRTRSPADAFERTPVALMRVAGPEQRYVAANRAYRELMGREHLLGRSPGEALPELAGRQQLEVLERVFRSGQPEHHRAWRTQVHRGGDDGAVVELFLDVSASPYFAVDGSVGGVDVSLVDVTELVQQRLAEQRRSQALAHRDRQRSAQVRELVVMLQDALLPPEVPVLPGLDVSARYLLATDEASAGGDWFDTVVRDDGTVVLLVGDVVGRGVAAVAAMGQLRGAVHQRLLTDASLEDVLSGLDRYARANGDAHAATVCAVQLDPATGALTYCTAGHPAPLLVRRDGGARFLPPSGAGPLATGGYFPVGHDRLEEGDLLLLYTDGIIERPGVAPSRSTLDLATTARDAMLGRGLPGAAPARGSERVCELALEMLVRMSGYRDDITLLAAQRTPAVPPLRLRRRADGSAVRATREQLADWLEEVDVRPLDELCVQHAVGELVANCVEHAYPPGTTGPVRVEACVDAAGNLLIEVADQGRWRTPTSAPHRGNGLAMVREFVDHVTVDRHAHGTTVRLRHRLARPAHLMRADTARGGPVPETPFDVQESPDERRLAISGALDLSTADPLRHALLQASRGGTTDLVVDLAGVTHLASAGVQVLSEVSGQLDGLVLRAPMGSVAQHVLETARLPYHLLRTDPRS